MASITVQQLLARLDQQQAEIDDLKAQIARGSQCADPPDPMTGTRPGMSRRGALKTAAAGALGLVGAGILDPGSAAYAAGKQGQTSFVSKSSAPTIKGTNTGTGGAISATSHSNATVHGSQTSAKAGAVALRGTIDNGKSQGGIGVVGIAPAGVGVSGSSTTGTGVVGSSSTGSGITGISASTAGGAVAIEGTITSQQPGGSSAGVLGQNNGTSELGIGVYGIQNGSGWGVYGTTPSGIGVYGYSSAGTGVQGGSSQGDGVYASSSAGNGVFGGSTSGVGVVGSAGSGIGVKGSSSSGYGIYASSPTNFAVVGLSTSGNGVYGQVSISPQSGVVGRTLDGSGNWAIYGFGNIGATGTKSAVVPSTDGKGHMTLYCVESPECWFEDFGSATLSEGSAFVTIDPEFAQTVDTDNYHVFLQAEGECRGLSVRGKTAAGFAVKELEGGVTGVRFSYRLVALRRNVTAPRLSRAMLPNAPAGNM